MIKAAKGGGGRGMRVVKTVADFDQAFESARNEATDGVRQPRRVRRKIHQPCAAHRSAVAGRRARQPRASVRTRLLGSAAASESRRNCPGTESVSEAARRHSGSGAEDRQSGQLFMRGNGRVSGRCRPNKFYFIEVNPRIQVEHTVTEEVTGYRHREVTDSGRSGHAAGGRRDRSWRSEERADQRVCHAVPSHHRRSGQQFHARLWPGGSLPLGGRHGHSAGRRQCVLRRGRQSVLRFAAGQSDGSRPAVHRRRRIGWNAACRNSASAA